ncbi:MAG: hypothetical protein HY849_08660 [Nitrosomonadales bacterium]|nr:hypothetical protein [Nitrosomonadales bacterium]
MSSPALLIVSTLKALIEIALMALLAQGLVGFLAGRSRQENFVYRLFQVITHPATRAVRAIAPKRIADAHIGWVSFFVLLWLWFALVYAKGYVCHAQHLACVPT